MKNIRFQTDYRLWLWTALALFFASWFFPIIIDKAGGTPVERIRWLLNFAAYGNTTFDRILLNTFWQAVFLMVVSVFLAWFVQVAIVIARTTKTVSFNRIPNP
jgi:ABC-type Fe3+ transport system permease subunit